MGLVVVGTVECYAPLLFHLSYGSGFGPQNYHFWAKGTEELMENTLDRETTEYITRAFSG